MKRWEVLANKVYDMLRGGRRLVFVFAPTGYGKTMASPYLLRLAYRDGMAARLIHIVPVRALLREIYCEKFRGLSGFKVGYQSMDRIPGGDKSPYFLSDLTVTTPDSFLWNIYKMPVAEISKILRGVSEGHYYPVFSAIATSIVVFDEAHIYMGEPGEKRGHVELAVISALKALQELKVPAVIATATMSSSFVKALVGALGLNVSDVGVVYACDQKCNKHVENLMSTGVEIEYVGGMPSSVTWHTSIIGDDKIADVVRERCRSSVVLAVMNTVDRAVEVYRRLREECGNATLIHSRLLEREREESYEKMRAIREEGRGLIVSSPIIEVGVEVDADVLVTEAAPIENLIQRAGRLCRRDRKCEAEVFIAKSSSVAPQYEAEAVGKTVEAVEKVLNEGKCVEWRLLSSSSCTPAIDILESISGHVSISKSDILAGYIVQDARPSALIEDVPINKLFRSLSLIKVVVEPSDINEIQGYAHEYVTWNSFTTSIPALSWLERSRGKCIALCDGGKSVKVLVLKARLGGGCDIRYYVSDLCSQALYEAIFHGDDVKVKSIHDEIRSVVGVGETAVDFFVVLRPDCYKRGEGAYV